MKTMVHGNWAVLLLAALLLGHPVSARSYGIDWYKVAGGGGTSTNGSLQIDGTVGQPDASGPLTGGGYSLAGGYVGVIAPVQDRYVAGPGGTISGPLSQLVNYGSSGAAVTAVPNLGYQFVNWSDGVTTATRTDLNETSNLSVTANFVVLSDTDVPLLGPWQLVVLGTFLFGFGARRLRGTR
jgi:hypothetical protein